MIEGCGQGRIPVRGVHGQALSSARLVPGLIGHRLNVLPRGTGIVRLAAGAPLDPAPMFAVIAQVGLEELQPGAGGSRDSRPLPSTCVRRVKSVHDDRNTQLEVVPRHTSCNLVAGMGGASLIVRKSRIQQWE